MYSDSDFFIQTALTSHLERTVPREGSGISCKAGQEGRSNLSEASPRLKYRDSSSARYFGNCSKWYQWSYTASSKPNNAKYPKSIEHLSFAKAQKKRERRCALLLCGDFRNVTARPQPCCKLPRQADDTGPDLDKDPELQKYPAAQL